MNTDTDIWFAFAHTFGMLFVVLAFFLLAFYLFRRFSGIGAGKGSDQLIRVMAVHHLAPKEKMVLVSVQNKTILVGVTPTGMSRLATLDHDPELISESEKAGGFSKLLGRTMKKQFKMSETVPDSGDRS
jgi:flagellar protein FliO/FliZ